MTTMQSGNDNNINISTHTDRRLTMARTLCQRAANYASWAIADRLAQSWLDCGCAELGCPAPADEARQPRQKRAA